MSEMLRLDLIRLDGGTQPRAPIDESLVGQYRDALVEQEAVFPPVVVFFDGVDYWLADGFHRWHSHKRAGREEIAADIRQGTKRDAVLHSFGANKDHGKRRDSADATSAVTRMLEDPEWRQWSDREIARYCGVSPTYVGWCRALTEQAERDRAADAHLSTRGQMEGEQGGSAPARPAATRKVKRGGKTFTMNAAAIGRRTKPGAKSVAAPSSPTAKAPDPVRRKVMALGEWLRAGHLLLNDLMDAVGDDAGLTWAAEVATLCAKHRVALYRVDPDLDLFCLLAATLGELSEAEEERREALSRPQRERELADQRGGGTEP